MTTTGTILEKLPIVTGEGKNGTWKKQDILLEIGDQYKKKLCVTIWGDKINIEDYQIGQTVTAHLDLESREYNGKWFSDIKAWKLESGSNSGGQNSSKESSSNHMQQSTPSQPASFDAGSGDDDLPF